MSKGNDPNGLAADRIRQNARVVALSSAIVNYTGDINGLKDLSLRNAEVNFRLTVSSTLAGTSHQQFGIGGISTD